jgi:hypothetical protein
MPLAVLTNLMERISSALLDGRFDDYRNAVVLPLTITPAGKASYVLTDLADLKQDFDLYRTGLMIQRVTDIVRQIRGVETLSDGAVRVHVTTHVMSIALRITDPFDSLLEFVCTAPGDWRLRRITSSVGYVQWSRGEAQMTPDGRILLRDEKEPT